MDAPLIEEWGKIYLAYVAPVIDILLLAFILYKAYRIIQTTRGEQLFKGGIILLLLYVAALVLRLSTLLWLLNMLAPGLVVGVAIIFQPELRKIFMKLGQSRFFRYSSKPKYTNIDAVLDAAEVLSKGGANKKPHGMLVVFQRRTNLRDFIETGQPLNADLTMNLLLTIFMFETAMHDGAVVIDGNKVLAAGCFLHLSEQPDIKKTYGTRHRAAIGTAETTDAVVLIVSEETGAISLAYDSKLYYDLSREELAAALERELQLKTEAVEVKEETDEAK